MSFDFNQNNQDNQEFRDNQSGEYKDYNPYGQDPRPQEPPHYLVTQRSKHIRSLGKQALKGHWIEAVVASFILELIMAGPGYILGAFSSSGILTFLSDLYGIVIAGPATLGLTAFFMGIFRMENPEKRILYRGLSDKVMFMKSLLVYCIMMLRIFLWSFVLIIPGFIAAFKYSMAFRVLADHPEYTPGQCLEASARIMDGNKLKLLWLKLSFFEMYLLESLPRMFCAEQAMGGNFSNLQAMLTDSEYFVEYMNELYSNPWMLLSYAIGIFVSIYVDVAECCFYDLAVGNLVVKQAEE